MAARNKKNVQNVIKFFENGGKDKMHVLNGLGDPFSEFSPEDAQECIRLYNKSRRAFEAWAAYARRYKTASTELSIDDLKEVSDLIKVKNVMES